MRTAIRQRLIDNVPEIEGRVLDLHSANQSTVKPFLVLSHRSVKEGQPWAGFVRSIEIRPCVDRTGTFQEVDNLCDKIVAVLDRQPITTGAGEGFTCRFTGAAGADHDDNEMDAISRSLKFNLLSGRPGDAEYPGEGDPWLEALSVWTGNMLGPGWPVYQNLWPVDYGCPGVLWRIAGVELKVRANSLYETKKKVVGHVAGTTLAEQSGAVLALARGLGASPKLLLDIASRSYMNVSDLTVDCQADALSAGQLSVNLSRLTTRPVEEAPLIMAVHNKGQVNWGG